MDLQKEFWNRHASCCEGRKLYNSITKDIDPEETALVIFPEDDYKLNYYGLLYLDEYLVRNLKKNVILVTPNDTVANAVKYFTNKIKTIHLTSKQATFDLISLYNFIDLEYQTVIVSLSLPLGRNANNLLGANGLSLEQLIAIGVYFLIPFKKLLRKIEYSGEDTKIMMLLSEGYFE